MCNKNYLIKTNTMLAVALCIAICASATAKTVSVDVINFISDYKEFIDDDFAHFPKCCPPKFALMDMNDTIECSNASIKFKHFELSSPNTTLFAPGGNFSESCGNLDCVDFYQNDTEWHLVRAQHCLVKTIYRHYTFFPKCCPADYAYDSKYHKCIPQGENIYEFGGSSQALNVSLSHCPKHDYAIIDLEDKFKIDGQSREAILENGKKFNYGSYCIDKNVISGDDMLRACVKYEDACGPNLRCLKKCCPDGEIYMARDGKTPCTTFYGQGIDTEDNERIKFANDSNFAIVIAETFGKYLAKPAHKFYIDDEAIFHIYQSSWDTLFPKDATYCIESAQLRPDIEPSQMFFLSIKNNKIFQLDRIKYYTTGILLALSCVFLLLTIGCYAILPEMQNVHGKSVLMLCIFLLVASLSLCIAQFSLPQDLNHGFCVTLGFSIFFSYLGFYAWLNIICFDMWIAFGSMRVVDLKNKYRNFKKFLYYNLYGWGVPVVICGFAIIVFNTNVIPYEYVPHIGMTKCYFEQRPNTYDYFIYFLGPETIMVLINCIFFIRTAIYCCHVKSEIQKMRNVTDLTSKEKRKQKYNHEKEKLLMILKLFMVMGLTFTFEVFSSFVSFKGSMTLRIIEMIVDAFNSGLGFLIFCIFILKKRVLQSLKIRLGLAPKRRPSEMSSTAVTNISSANGNKS